MKLRVGLTGGIASGKSSVGRELERLGAVLIDSDVLAREAVAKGTSGLEKVVEAFGAEVLAGDGSLDRPKLGARVFADDEARKTLEQIVHPAVRQRAAELEAKAGEDAIVVHDIPLLVETGQADRFDVLVVVDVPVEVQVDRLTTLRKMSEDEARSRIAAQASREERLAPADVVIVNNGTPEDLVEAVNALWEELQNAASNKGNTASK